MSSPDLILHATLSNDKKSLKSMHSKESQFHIYKKKCKISFNAGISNCYDYTEMQSGPESVNQAMLLSRE